MSPQEMKIIEMIEARLDRIEQKLDKNTGHIAKFIGMVVGISFITSASTSKILLPPPQKVNKQQIEQIMEDLKDENI